MKQSYTSAPKRRWLAPALSTLRLGAALLAAPAAHAQTTKIEAETSTLSGAAMVKTDIGPTSGSGYVDFTNKPAAVSFAYTAAAAGPYEVLIRYSSPFDFKLGYLSVNTGPKFPVYFNSTKTGASFRSTSRLRVTLTAGANAIIISDNYSYYGIDYIEVRPAGAVAALTPTAAGRVEAEAGSLTATQAYIRDDDAGPHSGDSYVGNFAEGTDAGSTISLPVNVATAGLYQIAVGARGLFSGKSIDVAVQTGTSNGGKLTTPVSESPTAFASYAVGKYNLTAGTNIITITSQTSYVEVDYVDVTATTGVATANKAGAEAQKALSAYPSPTNGQALRVSLETATAQAATVELVNALGQRVLSTSRSLKAGTNQFQLATERVSSGIYQLVVRRGDQPVLVKRVVIN